MSVYSEKYRDPRWQRKRLEIMQRDGFCCKGCGSEVKTLNVHHGYYEQGLDPWDYASDTLWTLCEKCHEEIQVVMRDLHFQMAKTHPELLRVVMDAILKVQEIQVAIWGG
jgi:hypothetical protein